MNVKDISISDYSYDLPDERIAKFPVTPRDQSQLLVYDGVGNITDDRFCHLASHLQPGALMVFNNTRVIHARLHFHKSTGAHIEVFLLEPYLPADYEQMFISRHSCTWLCLVGNLKKWKDEPLTLDRDEVIGLAGYEPDSFLPPSFMTSQGEIGPADMLFAMLDAAIGAPAVVLEPREQMPELSGGYASLRDLHMAGDSWVHSPDFRDAYISDRLRLQSWTIREE